MPMFLKSNLNNILICVNYVRWSITLRHSVHIKPLIPLKMSKLVLSQTTDLLLHTLLRTRTTMICDPTRISHSAWTSHKCKDLMCLVSTINIQNFSQFRQNANQGALPHMVPNQSASQFNQSFPSYNQIPLQLNQFTPPFNQFQNQSNQFTSFHENY